MPVDPQMLQNVRRYCTWDDMIGQAVARNLDVTSGRIDYDYDELTINFATNARYPEEPLGIANQLPHSWYAGSILQPHVHWFQNAAGAIPNFLLAYRFINNGEAVPSTWVLVPIGESVFTYPGSGTILQISQFPEIDASSLSWSDGIDIKLFRDTANASGEFAGADGFSGAAAVKFFDVHYPGRGRGTEGKFNDGF